MADPAQRLIEIEVVYGLPKTQTVVAIQVPPGTTVSQAIALSNIAAMHPEIAARSAIVGIFGRRVSISAVLRAHDRIEIYRPLIADPKLARRSRASKASQAKR